MTMQILKRRIWVPEEKTLDQPIRLIIAGSRSVTDYALCTQEIEQALSEWGVELDQILSVVNGGARGPDTLGERWAEQQGIVVEKFIPDWEKNGKAAGHIRNREMAKHASPYGGCVVLWDGVSAGSKGMIQAARHRRLWLSVAIVGQ